MRGRTSLSKFWFRHFRNFPHNATAPQALQLSPFLSYTPACVGLPVGKEDTVKHTLGEYKEAILNAASARSRERFLRQAEQEGFDAWALDELEKLAYPETGD